MKKLTTRSTVSLVTIVSALLFILNGCKKDLLVGSIKPAETGKLGQNNLFSGTNYHRHYGREFASLDSTVRDSEMVITPFGPRLKSDVHLIPDGHKLKYSGTHLQEIDIASGKLINDFGVQAPLKYIKSSSQNSMAISAKTIKTVISPVAATASWKTWAQTSTVKAGLGNGFTGNWVVPSLPTTKTDGQIIFIFVGLTDGVNAGSIVQPIIQFGYNNIGGSNTTWSMSNCFIAQSNSQAFYSTYYPVATGAHITGAIQLSGTPGTQTVNSSVADNIHISYLPTETAMYPFTTVVATLEDYNVISASDYPPDSYVPMTLPLTQNLVPEINSTPAPLYGEHTDVPASGTGYAYLYFHPETIPVISYTSPVGYTVNTVITPLTPTVSGGNPTTTYSVSPALPTGLTLNTSTGVISGTPTVMTQPNSNTYTVTVTNGAGSGHANISIEIWAAPALVAAYGGPGTVNLIVTPNIPSPSTGVLNYKDLTTGGSVIQSAGSPYGWSINNLTLGHNYQFFYVEYGTGSPGSATSNTVQYTIH